jgi:hypothetical protein
MGNRGLRPGTEVPRGRHFLPKPYILVFCTRLPAAGHGRQSIIQAMFLKAGALSLALLLASRLLGLARESAQAAAFGTSGLGMWLC